MNELYESHLKVSFPLRKLKKNVYTTKRRGKLHTTLNKTKKIKLLCFKNDFKKKKKLVKYNLEKISGSCYFILDETNA